MTEELAGSASDLGPGSVTGVGDWAVLNVDGHRYAVSRRCRHLRADLANGTIDDDGCLVCPWHHAVYNPESGRMVKGPQEGFQRVPGLDAFYRELTKLFPLRHAKVIERDGQVFVDS